MALTHYQHAADEATARLVQRYSPSGNRIGWMMIADDRLDFR
jgi:hypothetical protein